MSQALKNQDCLQFFPSLTKYPKPSAPSRIPILTFNWINQMAVEYFWNSYKLSIGETRWLLFSEFFNNSAAIYFLLGLLEILWKFLPLDFKTGNWLPSNLSFSHKISKAMCSIKNSYSWKFSTGATRWLRNTFGILINFQLEKSDGFGNCLGILSEF